MSEGVLQAQHTRTPRRLRQHGGGGRQGGGWRHAHLPGMLQPSLCLPPDACPCPGHAQGHRACRQGACNRTAEGDEGIAWVPCDT